MKIFDAGNELSEEPSKAELLHFLNANDTTEAAESAYNWLLDQSLRQQQRQQVAAIGPSLSVLAAPVVANLWNVLSSLENLGKSVDLTMETIIENGKLVIVIGNVPDDNAASLLIEELLVLIFNRLSNMTSRVTHTNNTTTARIRLA